jgi:hypothetical protein
MTLRGDAAGEVRIRNRLATPRKVFESVVKRVNLVTKPFALNGVAVAVRVELADSPDEVRRADKFVDATRFASTGRSCPIKG